MNDHKNTILAIVLSAIVLIAWQYFYGLPQMQKQKQAEAQKTVQTTQPKAGGTRHFAAGGAAVGPVSGRSDRRAPAPRGRHERAGAAGVRAKAWLPRRRG